MEARNVVFFGVSFVVGVSLSLSASERVRESFFVEFEPWNIARIWLAATHESARAHTQLARSLTCLAR